MRVLDNFVRVREMLNGCVAGLVADGYPEDLAKRYVLQTFIEPQGRAEPVYACGDRTQVIDGREVRCKVPENEPHAIHRADHPFGAGYNDVTWGRFRPEKETE